MKKVLWRAWGGKVYIEGVDAGKKVNVKIDSEANAALRLIAVQRGVSADEARDEAIRIGIAAMSRRRKARRRRKTTG